jgi:hypothetical protein
VSESTIEGHVRLVQFQPMGEWFLSIQIDERWNDDRQGWRQIDGADYYVDGRPVSKFNMVIWLAIWFEKRDQPHGLPRVKLTGQWGTYETCSRAEFFPPQPVEPPRPAEPAGLTGKAAQ